MSTRVSARELERIAAELTDRDRAVIDMLAAVKLATGHQLRRATLGDDSAAAKRAARRQLQRLVSWRVVARLDRRQGGLGRGSEAWTYALDVSGRRLAGMDARRPHLPGRTMWAHALLGAEVFTRLIEATRSTDRAVKEWQGEPASWRRFGSYDQSGLVKPDAFVVVTGGGYEDACFVEIDMGTQSRPVIRAKLDAYRRYAATGREQDSHGVFPLVVVITRSEARHAQLVDLVSEQPQEAWRLFAVGLVDDAVRLLTGGGL